MLPQLAGYGPIVGPPDGATCSLRAVGSSPGVARHFTIATLRSWGLARLTDDAAIIVSELVTNAVHHGTPPGADMADDRPVRLTIVRHGRLVVCIVADADPNEPVLRDPGDFAENGRGLQVVEALSRTWGWTRLPDSGKAVWAALAIT